MRGDSIRDLYAKTLALLGLGVLAGTGALVDYWPSGVRLPAVEAGFVQPELSLSLALAVPTQSPLQIPDRTPDQTIEAEVRVASARPAPSRQPIVSQAVNLNGLDAPDELAALTPETTQFEIADVMSGDAVQTVALSRPAVLTPVTFATDDSMASLGEELSLSEPAPWTESALVMSSAPVGLSAADDGGVIAGVVRATKSSLALTGRKTGASILSAFRVVSGAVKKALPN